MSKQDANFAIWIQRHPPPSLEALIKKHGCYSAIPKPEWQDFDAAYAQWEEQRKTRLR